MDRPPRLSTRMDARAWRAPLLGFLLFGGVGLVLMFGAATLGLKGGGQAVERWMGAGVHGPWALPAAVGGFTVLAFLGVPQFVLTAAAVVAFGAWTGFAYSFLGNLVSAVAGFLVGRRFGARLLPKRAGALQEFMDMVGRNGLLASAAVRLVPSAPFVVVNMAAGVTPMSLWSFTLGTAVGSVPKLALTAFAGAEAMGGLHGGGWTRWAGLALVALVWIGGALWTRAWFRRRRGARAAEVRPPG